ncbi:MFS transporter [Streptomyces thermoalcalitolerans]|uniref:MFS transporter n=1 Tax=Streptomyces thermoalcalitolerans TaxID=65605 RepID=A0ABN1P7R5_9ACTN
MHDMSSGITTDEPTAVLHTGWTRRVVGHAAILILVNVMVDTVIASPTFVLPELSDAFDTHQFAWIDSSAMLAGATWAPLLGKSADIHGKRTVLILTLLVAGTGGIVCLLAPHISVFVLGRVLQGAAVAGLFLTVAIVRDLCAPKFAMVVTGVITSGSAVFGIVSPFVLEVATDAFGWRVVFVLSAAFAGMAAVFVRCVIPDSRNRTPGRVDVAGALTLGGGLAGVLAYISLGQEFGWLSGASLAFLIGGVAALLVWYVVLSRVPEPVIDIRGISSALGLGLLVVVMGTGAYRSMLQLFGLLVDVDPDDGLGYGIAGPGALGLMFGIPSVGIMLGGVLAGWIGTRVGPAWPLAAGITLGATASLVMFTAGTDTLPVAVVCSFMFSLTAGSLVTSGFNLASVLAPPERQGTVSSMVMVMVAIGSVTMSFIGSAVLGAHEIVFEGEKVSSSAGIHAYIAVAGCVFVLAAVPTFFLVRTMRGRVVPDVSEVTHKDLEHAGR